MDRYDERTALLIVDVQNDFADPDGSLHVPGGEDVVEEVNAEVGRARDGGAVVVYTQDWHPPVTPHFVTSGGLWPEHCVQGTWGAELHPRLEVVGPVVRKGTGGEDGYSGFTVRDPETGEEHATDLEPLLRAHGVERLVIGGLATDYCVKETALDGARLSFSTTVLGHAVRAVDRQAGDGEAAFQAMREAGVVIT